MARQIRNVGASVRARLLQVSKRTGQNFDLVLNRYAVERLLYRLTQSRHANRFILKGAMLLMTWFDEPLRVSRDLDLLAHAEPIPEAVLGTFREIFDIDGRDGVNFDASGARLVRIREDTEYGGFRIRTSAEIGGARIAVSIDIAFGDATDPAPEVLDYPVLLDMPSPRLRGYARETVVAEKFHAMVVLGRDNSRMKDYFDIWMLSQSFDFEQSRLARAISANFARRGAAIPDETPDALMSEFAEDEWKQRQWDAFRRNVAAAPALLADVVAPLEVFLMPAAEAARNEAERRADSPRHMPRTHE